MPGEQEFGLAIEACLEAAFEFSRWPGALQKLADSLGISSCVIRCGDPSHPFRTDQRGRTRPAPESSAHAEFAALWLEKIDGAPDPFEERKARLAKPVVSFTTEDEITTEEERKVLPYYQEIARPGDRAWRATVTFKVQGQKWCFPMFRNEQKGRFYPRESQYFLSIAPKLSQMVSMAEKVSASATISALRSLDQFLFGAVVLDNHGKVVRTNERAQSLLGSDLTIRHGRIHAADQVSDNRLQPILMPRTRNQRGSAGASKPALITRKGTPWLLAEALPMCSIAKDFFDGGETLLVFSEVATSMVLQEDILRETFHFTPAEMRLASRLLKGEDLESASSYLGVGRETVRSQLRALMAKTDTHRQSELAQLLLRFRIQSRQ